jgi:hypothetical protein
MRFGGINTMDVIGDLWLHRLSAPVVIVGAIAERWLTN